MADFLAVDLGATSGRIALGRVSQDRIDVEIIHRFTHEVKSDSDGSLLWDWNYIVNEVIFGLKQAIKTSEPTSLAIDAWAVDYGFLDAFKKSIPPIYSYRDSRTEKVYLDTIESIGRKRIYSTTGIQFLQFNTIYQLVAARDTLQYKTAKNLLLLPDLFNAYLTGVVSTEVTNASTTQLLNTTTRQWDYELIELAGLRRDLFTHLHEPGTLIGKIVGFGPLDGIDVWATASHDTAAAIAGVPFSNRESEAYISSGTWSLVGIENDKPITSKEAFEANLTNEVGVYGTVRILKNVTGLWLLEECRRAWRESGEEVTISQLVAAAQEIRDFDCVIDPNDPCFTFPGGMPQRIADYCENNELRVPITKGEFTFCILQSLAVAYRDALDEISAVTGRTITTLHVLGGGSQISFLNQMTADACGLRVKTGPVEATLFGNIAVQAIAAGIIKDLPAARKMISKSFTSQEFLPTA